MRFQRALLRERCRTVFTHVWLLLGVLPHVRAQCVRARQPFTANIARKRTFPRVHLLVLSESHLVEEALTAQRALEPAL